MKMRKLKKGFSLVEMLVVVAIIGILSTVLYTSYTKYVGQSRKAVAKAEALEIVEVFQTAMTNHAGMVRDEEVDVTNYLTYAELGTLDMKEAYEEATGLSLASTVTLSYDANAKTLNYSNNGIRVTFNTATSAVSVVEL